MRARQQLLHHRPKGGSAKDKRLLAGTSIEHAIGKYMAALEIGSELGLVDRQKGDVEIARHGFDGANPESRILRLDLLFAGDQRDRILSHAIGDLVVDLTREQPQRQADHAGGMGQHALDGEMGLAGIGGAQHRRDTGTAGSRCSGRLRGKSDGHYASGLAGGPSIRPSRKLSVSQCDDEHACG